MGCFGALRGVLGRKVMFLGVLYIYLKEAQGAYCVHHGLERPANK